MPEVLILPLTVLAWIVVIGIGTYIALLAFCVAAIFWKR